MGRYNRSHNRLFPAHQRAADGYAEERRRRDRAMSKKVCPRTGGADGAADLRRDQSFHVCDDDHRADRHYAFGDPSLEESANVVYFILRLAGSVVAIRVYRRPGSPSYKLVWMCLLLALPVSGMILFWLWGGTPPGQEPEPAEGPASAGAGESADERALPTCPV